MFCMFQTTFGQVRKSSLGLSFGSTQYHLENILNNKIGYNYGNFGLHYYYKIDTAYFLLATYTNGGVPDNSGNTFGSYKELKSSFNRGNLSLYKSSQSTQWSHCPGTWFRLPKFLFSML